MRLPDFAVPALSMFQPAFAAPTYNRFLVLLLGAILTTGRRTITNLLGTVRHHATRHVSSYHWVFSQRLPRPVGHIRISHPIGQTGAEQSDDP